MEAADSPLAVNLCTPGGDGCTRTTDCAMANVWTRAENAMRDVLAGTSIAEVMSSGSTSLELTDLTKNVTEPLPCQEL
jgi:DNA-binding IscR family transcriptional regulator